MVRGQWLMYGVVKSQLATIDPACTLFSFKHTHGSHIHNVVSEVPYFSARFIANGTNGESWNSKGTKPAGFPATKDQRSRMSFQSGQTAHIDNASMNKSLEVQAEQGKLFLLLGNNKRHLLLDTTEDKFVAIQPPYASPSV